MYSAIGRTVERAWPIILLGWIVALVGLKFAAPAWDSVAEDGEFSFLPDGSPSRHADELFNAAFPRDLISSSIVVVVDSDHELSESDLEFVSGTLKNRLESIAEADGGLAVNADDGSPNPATKSVISQIHAWDDTGVGALLISKDRRATLLIVELTMDFFSRRNQPTIERIESLIAQLNRDRAVPDGLSMHITGSAVVGRDITTASERSAASTGRWTIILVIGLTLLVFRAPLVALIPLVTLFFAMEVALGSLALLAGAQLLGVFKGIEAYITVIVYASGVDYSLFLISRAKEEFAEGLTLRQSVTGAVTQVGAAITASAATEICGIGMMAFAEFGKFHEAGIAIAIALAIMLLAMLTLTPALLHLAGPLAFWPEHAATAGRARRPGWIESIWERIGQMLLARPGTIWLTSVLLMAPFAAWGVVWYNHLDYDLVSQLPATAPSAVGTEALQRHFAAGTTGPVNLLIRNDNLDFREPEGTQFVQELTDRLWSHRDELQIASIRSLAVPLGIGASLNAAGDSTARRVLTAGIAHRRAIRYFVGKDDTLGPHVTRLELELALDPFSQDAMDQLDRLEARVRSLIPDEQARDETAHATEVFYSGSTASLRDVRAVGARDRNRINLLVVASVAVILFVLLRRVGLTVYLLATVLFSYLVTLGVTFAVFYFTSSGKYAGVDWTVPLFLFTVLIAIGEDYNILLVTRIDEEQRELPPEEGIVAALVKTGPIISSCGLIMAGTFLSLSIGGHLSQMVELGFALAFGVLLETFFVRPVLVPAFLILLHRRRAKPKPPLPRPTAELAATHAP